MPPFGFVSDRGTPSMSSRAIGALVEAMLTARSRATYSSPASTPARSQTGRKK